MIGYLMELSGSRSNTKSRINDTIKAAELTNVNGESQTEDTSIIPTSAPIPNNNWINAWYSFQKLRKRLGWLFITQMIGSFALYLLRGPESLTTLLFLLALGTNIAYITVWRCIQLLEARR